MSTNALPPDYRITSLADLCRYISPDHPVDIVDTLVKLYHEPSANHGTIATAEPYAYLVFITWDGMDHHPTADQLREAVSAASRANPPAPAFRIDHMDVALSWTTDRTLAGKNLVEFAYGDTPPAMYVETCDPRGSFCRGVTLYVRATTGTDAWTVVHLPAAEAMILAGAIHHAFLHHSEG